MKINTTNTGIVRTAVVGAAIAGSVLLTAAECGKSAEGSGELAPNLGMDQAQDQAQDQDPTDLLGGSGGSDPGGTNGPVPVPVGTPVSISEEDGSMAVVTVTEVEFRADTHPSFGSFVDGPQNEHFLVATIRITSSTGGFDYNQFNWSVVVDGQQYVSPGLTFATSNQEGLGSGTVFQDATVTGKVAWDVDGDSGRILYTPNLSGGPIAVWSFGSTDGAAA